MSGFLGDSCQSGFVGAAASLNLDSWGVLQVWILGGCWKSELICIKKKSELLVCIYRNASALWAMRCDGVLNAGAIPLRSSRCAGPAQCPHSARTVPAQCPLVFYNIFWKAYRSFPNTFYEHILKLFWERCTQARTTVKYKRALCGHCAGTVRALCGHCAGTVQALCRHCAGTARGCALEVSIHYCCGKHV